MINFPYILDKKEVQAGGSSSATTAVNGAVEFSGPISVIVNAAVTNLAEYGYDDDWNWIKKIYSPIKGKTLNTLSFEENSEFWEVGDDEISETTIGTLDFRNCTSNDIYLGPKALMYSTIDHLLLRDDQAFSFYGTLELSCPYITNEVLYTMLTHSNAVPALVYIDDANIQGFYAENAPNVDCSANCRITHLVIPANITEFGSGRIITNSPYDVVFEPREDDVSFGEIGYTFSHGATSIDLAENITSLVFDFANGNTSLTSIIFPSTITNLGSDSFLGCTNLSNITFRNADSSDSREAISFESGLFNDCCPTSIILPNNLAEAPTTFGTSIESITFLSTSNSGINSFIDYIDNETALDHTCNVYTKADVTQEYIDKAAAKNYIVTKIS